MRELLRHPLISAPPGVIAQLPNAPARALNPILLGDCMLPNVTMILLVDFSQNRRMKWKKEMKIAHLGKSQAMTLLARQQHQLLPMTHDMMQHQKLFHNY